MSLCLVLLKVVGCEVHSTLQSSVSCHAHVFCFAKFNGALIGMGEKYMVFFTCPFIYSSIVLIFRYRVSS